MTTVASGGTSFRQSLAIQFRVIFALLMREVITRYGRHNLGFLWLFMEPMIFTLGITAVWSMTRAVHSSTVPIVAFAVTGYSSVQLWRNAANRCAKAIEPNLSLLFHRNVRVIDIFASRLILEIAGATTSFFLLSVFFITIDWMEMPVDLLKMVAAWVLLAWFAIGLGLIIGPISERSEMFERIWHTITYLTFPLSGAMFMLDWFPKGPREFLLWSPVIHGVEMLRHGYFGDAVKTYEEPTYLIITNLFLMLIGLAMTRETSRRVEP